MDEHWAQEYVKVREAARILGLCPDTVRKRVSEGRLPRTVRTGGFSSPILIHLADLRAMLRVGTDLKIAGNIITDKASDTLRLQELNARCMKLAEVLGSRDAIVRELQAVGGVDSLGALCPSLYAKFRTRLIRLANPMAKGQNGPAGKFVKRAKQAQDARSAAAEPWELVTGPAGTK